jgi:hypothetical protein
MAWVENVVPFFAPNREDTSAMARTAINQLQDQIEAVRREAFAAGYAAAMQSIRELASRPAPSPQAAAAAVATPRRRGRRPGRPRQAAPAAAQPTRQRRARRATAATRTPRAGGRRPQRGTNARMVEEILQAAAPRAVRPAEIRKALQDKGVAMAFTSIRHALGQLESRHSAEQIADSKTWRYRTGGSPS